MSKTNFETSWLMNQTIINANDYLVFGNDTRYLLDENGEKIRSIEDLNNTIVVTLVDEIHSETFSKNNISITY